MRCELILPRDINKRGRAIIEAMASSASESGVSVYITESYTGRFPFLMTYGMGHPGRRSWINAQRKRQAHVIGWDLGYWDRDSSMRLTIDADHPQRMIRDMPSSRWAAANISLRNDYKESGPIILIGMGRKSRSAFGYSGQSWEADMAARLRRAHPGREILYKPKGIHHNADWLNGVRSVSGPIQDVLRGAYMVVSRHSNVSIDACIAGIPAVTEDGAAAALYGNDINQPYNPPPSERLKFLQNLAWWQWRPSEAKQAWSFICKICD